MCTSNWASARYCWPYFLGSSGPMKMVVALLLRSRGTNSMHRHLTTIICSKETFLQSSDGVCALWTVLDYLVSVISVNVRSPWNGICSVAQFSSLRFLIWDFEEDIEIDSWCWLYKALASCEELLMDPKTWWDITDAIDNVHDLFILFPLDVYVSHVNVSLKSLTIWLISGNFWLLKVYPQVCAVHIPIESEMVNEAGEREAKWI